MDFYLLLKTLVNMQLKLLKSNKCSQKLVDRAIKSEVTKVATDAIKTTSKRAIQKTAEAAGDLVGNKIAYKITSVSKKLKNYL